MSTFEASIGLLLSEEGGYVNDPSDPGGETKYGISKRQYPDLDIKNLTQEEAEKIYKRDYWEKYHVDDIEDQAVANKYFSILVNAGPQMATLCLQRALRACGFYVTDDGKFGPDTANAARRADAMSLLAAFRSEIAGFYRVLAIRDPANLKFIKGWLARAYS